MSLKELDIDGVGRAVFQHCTSPKALYVTLIERWWVLALGCILGVVAGFFVIKGSQKKFMSKGRLLVYQKLPTFMDDATRIPDPKAYDSLFATHVQLIGSPLIVEKAVKEFNLDGLAEIDELHESHRKLGNRTVGEMIRENLHVGRAGSGDSAGAFVLSVEYKHKSAKECPEVVEAILKTYRSYVNQSVLDDQSKAVQLLGQLKTKLDLDIKQKGDVYRDFLKAAPGIWDQMTKMNFHHKRVESFEDELTQLEIKHKAVASRKELLKKKVHPETGEALTDLDKLALVDDLHLPRLEILISLTSDSNLGRLQEIYPQMQEVASVQFDDLLTKLLELSSLSKNVGKQHPKYLDALADVELLKSQLKSREASNPQPTNKLKPADLVSAYEVLLEEELNHLNDRIAFVKDRIESEVDASKRLHDVSIRADQLKDEYDRASEISGALLDKMQKQTVLSQFGSYVAEIIESPKKGQLVWPKKPVILVLCTICGFFLGSFSALLLDLIEVSPLRSLFNFMPKWLIRDRFRSPGSAAS